MIAQVTADAARFRDLVSSHLQRDPVLNTVLLTTIDARAGGDVVDERPPTFVSVHDGADVVGAAMRVVPRGIFLGALAAEYGTTVADALAVTAPDAPAVEGLEQTTRAFVVRWATLLGVEGHQSDGTRLHLLRDVRPQTAAGQMRPATPDDVSLLVDWVSAFGVEVGQAQPVQPSVVERWVSSGRAWLWVHGGRPVSLVVHQAPSYEVVRIGPVYTPPPRRGHGYASALTGQVASALQAGGARVCLYTQLGNPTSNKIYAALGFEPVADFSTYSFGRSA